MAKTKKRRSAKRRGEEEEPKARRYLDDEEDDYEEEDDEEDDYEEERRPRKRKSSKRSRARDEEDEDEDDDEEEDEDDDDEDDEPRSRKKSRGKNDPVSSGWDGYKRAREASSDFPDELKVDEEAMLIKLLEDSPFATWNQHWIDELQGKKSFTCLQEDCPLCDIGDKPRAMAAFNVVLMSEGKPSVLVWKVGPMVAGQLKNLNKDKKTGPLTKFYWSVSKTTGKGKTTYNIIPVKERDLEEDWEVEPLTPKEIKRHRKSSYDNDAVDRQTRKELKRIASQVADDE